MAGVGIEGVEMENGVLRCGEGTLERRKGINIVRLSGTHAEMGWQHGRLAAAVCGDMVGDYFNRVVEVLIGHSAKAVAGPASRFIKWLFYALNRKRIGAEYTEELVGLAKGLGIPPHVALKLILVPDILHYIIGKVFPMYAAPSCSGFMAKDTATEGGRLIVGRNFDFFGQGVWDEANALLLFSPAGGRKYCWIGALGVPGSGQGMNESGIIISLHTKFTKDVRLTGIPLFTLMGAMLEKCGTLDEAMRMITAQPRMCGLSMFIVDSKARDAAVVGFSANRAEIVRPEYDVLTRTNHYFSDEMKKLEVPFYGWKMHSEGRLLRLREILEEKRGALRPRDVPAILADNLDYWERRRRVAGCILGATNNAQSVVFSPDEDSMWLADGPFPVCCADAFRGFSISALFNGDMGKCEIPDLTGAGLLDDKEKEAQRLFQEAWTDHLENFRDDLALKNLRAGEALLPDEPVFPRMAGLILLKEKKFEQALPFFERNAAAEYRSDLRRAESLVWLGRCLDLLGRHEEAIPHYRAACTIPAPPISEAAKNHVNSPFREKQLFDVSPEFIIETALAKY